MAAYVGIFGKLISWSLYKETLPKSSLETISIPSSVLKFHGFSPHWSRMGEVIGPIIPLNVVVNKHESKTWNLCNQRNFFLSIAWINLTIFTWTKNLFLLKYWITSLIYMKRFLVCLHKIHLITATTKRRKNY